MPKFGTTARKLLASAAKSQAGLVSIHTGYITGRRGCPSYGSRNHSAAVLLQTYGLLSFKSLDHGTHHFIGNTSADYYTEWTFAITAEGREFVG